LEEETLDMDNGSSSNVKYLAASTSSSYVVSMSNVTACWSSSSPALHAVNLKVEPKTLVTIVGRVGAGKVISLIK